MVQIHELKNIENQNNKLRQWTLRQTGQMKTTSKFAKNHPLKTFCEQGIWPTNNDNLSDNEFA
jgi:hypothetical protein